MFQSIAFEAHQPSGYRKDTFNLIFSGIEDQLTALVGLPALIQVADDGKFAPRMATKTIEMALIKGTCGVFGVVKFGIQQPQVAGAIEVGNKGLDFVKVGSFGGE